MKVEVCLISARGLRRPTSLWKLQWFAVGWIDPNNKYCTKIDASGSTNPTWKTKFSIQVDVDESEESHHSLQDLALHVQVFSREPIFLRERLQGTATILLKEFFAKYNNHANRNSSSSSVPPSDNRGGGNEDVGSFQLRKGNPGKPQGFVDVSIRVYDEREGYGGLSYAGTNIASGEGIIDLAGTNYGNEMHLGAYHPQSQFQSHLPPSNANWPQQSHPHARHVPDLAGTNNGNERYLGTHHPQPQLQSHMTPASNANWQQQSRHPNSRQVPINSNTPPPAASNSTYYRPPPPPPPPPSHVGFVSTFHPRTDAGTSGRGNDFLTGATAGALGAGAIIFGDDYMSGFNNPPGLQDHSGYS